MQLFVIRHAVAEDVVVASDDATRALTTSGKAKLRRVVRGLAALGLRFDRVLTSPWKRAVQTAALLEPMTRAKPVATELLARSPTSELLAAIAERNDSVAVVGHEPWLGELAAWLTFGDARHGDGLIIKKAGVIWLEGSAAPGGMQLRAVLPPKVLRAIR